MLRENTFQLNKITCPLAKNVLNTIETVAHLFPHSCHQSKVAGMMIQSEFTDYLRKTGKSEGTIKTG